MILIYTTCPSVEQAKAIAKRLLEDKLIACANIINSITSLYDWQGKLCEENEVILLLKTIEEKYPEIQEKITELHSYDCPCVLKIKIDDVKDALKNEVFQSGVHEKR